LRDSKMDHRGPAPYDKMDGSEHLRLRHAARRRVVRSTLGVGFAAAVAPIAATMTTTDRRGMIAGDIRIPGPDGTLAAYRAQPAGKTGLATVLVVQEIFGVPEYIKDGCRRLGKLEYVRRTPGA